MIGMYSKTDVINNDVESFVVTMLKGIQLADKMGANYTLEITRDDVAVLAEALEHIHNVEVS